MIAGVVTVDHEPVVRLRVRGPGGVEEAVDFVVDTGFTGALLLPTSVVETLGLPWRSAGMVILADGSIRRTDYHEAELEWGAAWLSVLAMSVGPEALLGMRMLTGHRLIVEGGPCGEVAIISTTSEAVR